MKRETYDLLSEPAGAAYRVLLRVAARYCREFGLVHQRRVQTLGLERVLHELKPYLIGVTQSRSWPGNEMAPGYSADVYRYRLMPKALVVLETAVDRLYAWSQLDRPEDLHILRSDGSVWLGSIAHESDGWLVLDQSELSVLQAEAPDLELRRQLVN